MSNTRLFYGSRKQPVTTPLDWMVQSWVPKDGLESDDPDWGGGGDDGNLSSGGEDGGDLSSSSDWNDDGK